MEEGDAVNPETCEAELNLREQLEQSQQDLEALERELADADAELQKLARRSPEFEALGRVCRSLEELNNIGATNLFWEGGLSDAEERIEDARKRIHYFGETLIHVEKKRNKIAHRIGNQNVVLDHLHFDLNDVIEREEARRNEWLVERDADDLAPHAQVMPWTRGYEEDDRFNKALGISMAASIALAIILSSIALPIVERNAVIEIPERVAKLVRQELPKPPTPVEQPVIEELEPEPEIEPEPQLAEEAPPEVVPESAEEPAVAAAPQQDSKEQVKSKGILAFRDSFASSAMLKPTAQLGSQARVRAAGEDATGRPERSMVTTLAPGSSGGINLADISRDVGGGGGGEGLGGVQVSRVASSIGGGGTADRPMSGGAFAGRTDEEIQIVFDRYKAALYRLYNRELRRDPTLRGQMVLKLTIEPDGSVSFCTLQSSDMDAPTLADQVVERVTTFDFGAKEDIVAITIVYPIDFLPAA
jgi:hypothetical protein